MLSCPLPELKLDILQITYEYIFKEIKIYIAQKATHSLLISHPHHSQTSIVPLLVFSALPKGEVVNISFVKTVIIEFIEPRKNINLDMRMHS